VLNVKVMLTGLSVLLNEDRRSETRGTPEEEMMVWC